MNANRRRGAEGVFAGDPFDREAFRPELPDPIDTVIEVELK